MPCIESMATQSGWQTFSVLFRQSQVLYLCCPVQHYYSGNARWKWNYDCILQVHGCFGHFYASNRENWHSLGGSKERLLQKDMLESGWFEDEMATGHSTYYPSGLLTPEQGRCFKAIGCLILRGPQTCCVIGPWTPEEWSHFVVQWGHWGKKKKRLVARKPIISF